LRFATVGNAEPFVIETLWCPSVRSGGFTAFYTIIRRPWRVSVPGVGADEARERSATDEVAVTGGERALEREPECVSPACAERRERAAGFGGTP